MWRSRFWVYGAMDVYSVSIFDVLKSKIIIRNYGIEKTRVFEIKCTKFFKFTTRRFLKLFGFLQSYVRTFSEHYVFFFVLMTTLFLFIMLVEQRSCSEYLRRQSSVLRGLSCKILGFFCGIKKIARKLICIYSTRHSDSYSFQYLQRLE